MARDVHSREQNEIMRQLGLLALVVMLVVVVMMIPLGGALAGLWHEGRWAWPSGTFITTMRDIVLHPNRPAQAYPSDIRSALPGPVGYWASVAALEALLLFTAVFVIVVLVSGGVAIPAALMGTAVGLVVYALTPEPAPAH